MINNFLSCTLYNTPPPAFLPGFQILVNLVINKSWGGQRTPPPCPISLWFSSNCSKFFARTVHAKYEWLHINNFIELSLRGKYSAFVERAETVNPYMSFANRDIRYDTKCCSLIYPTQHKLLTV